MKTTLIVDNIHCPSCVKAIEEIFINEASVHVNLLSKSVTLEGHKSRDEYAKELEQYGFSVVEAEASNLSRTHGPASNKVALDDEEYNAQWQSHLAFCKACQAQELDPGEPSRPHTPKGKEPVTQVSEGQTHKTQFVVSGLTCASCISSIRNVLESEKDIVDVAVTLTPPLATVVYRGGLTSDDVAEMIEDCGFDVGGTIQLDTEPNKPVVETTLSISGMTCSSCVNSLTPLLQQAKGVFSATVSLLPPMAVVSHDTSVIGIEELVEIVDDAGFEAALVSSKNPESETTDALRTISININGMFCTSCSEAINALLEDLAQDHSLASYTPIEFPNPRTTLAYYPNDESSHFFTLRELRRRLADLGPFTIEAVYASATLTSLTKQSQHKEMQTIFWYILVTFIFLIPTFLISIVFMTLCSKSNPVRQYFEYTLFNSALSRGTFALFLLATPVQFGIGSYFYKKAFSNLFYVVWRKNSSWWTRLFRWGSMDTLVALGTSAAYFSSLAYMVLDWCKKPDAGDMENGHMKAGEMGYFDSTTFIIFFILLGRYLDSVTKSKTSNAIDELGKMRSEKGLLFVNKEETIEESVDFLDLNDRLLVPLGSTVPLDCILLSEGVINVDESSLTGESKYATKKQGEALYAGSINMGPSAVTVRVASPPGESTVDSIIDAVRDALSKQTGLQKVADVVTSYFVPAVCSIALLTFLVWIARGYANALPRDYLDDISGSWALFAIQFSIAVLVVACPCGIGLAAPTAQMVGTGLCAKMGIVPYGGGEAFEKTMQVDCVVFDKTGTLTQGEFTVVDSYLDPSLAHSATLRLVSQIESNSTHPISQGIQKFCEESLASSSGEESKYGVLSVEEIPGRGLKATVVQDEGALSAPLSVLIGNESLLKENSGQQTFTEAQQEFIQHWKGYTLIYCRLDDDLALFALGDQPKPESRFVISQLKKQNILPFMCTGDNAKTAQTVAEQVGIDYDCVRAQVLPIEKQDFIKDIQDGKYNDMIEDLRNKKRRLFRGSPKKQIKVMFIGDGINDIVALTQSNVGVSMGSGASVALKSSDFCILSSNLSGVLTVLKLSRATIHKIISNFIWACCFNTALIPIAAGAFYSLGKTRLPPVWAALAMALSSISVVSNSLLLRYTFKPPQSMDEF